MNSIPGISEPYSTQILNLFKKLPTNTEVILFGSRAKGTFREGSDIDIALKGEQVDLELSQLISNQYEDLELPWKLDIAVYSLIDEPALKDHIDRTGIFLRLP